MSPLVASAYPNLETAKSDCHLANNLNSSESYNFSPSSADAAGLNYLKTRPRRSSLSRRSKPRRPKIRRKQMEADQVEKSVKADLGFNGSSDFEFGNVPGGKNTNLGSNWSPKSGVLNGSMGQLNFGSDGLGFGVSSNDSLFSVGWGNGKSLFDPGTKSSTSTLYSKESNSAFASKKGGSYLDAQKETGTFLFGAHQPGFKINQNLPGGQFVFGIDEYQSSRNSNFSAKESCGNLGQPKVGELHKLDKITGEFASNNYASASRVKLDKPDSKKSNLQFGVGEFGKDNYTSFVFGASMNTSAEISSESEKQECGKNMDKSESVKDAGNTVPDMRGKVKLDATGGFEKVCHSSFQFPFTWGDSSRKHHVNFVFGSNKSDSKLDMNLEHNHNSKYKDMFNSANSGEKNAENEIQFQNACFNGVFVFGGLKGKGGEGLRSGGSTKVVNDTSQLNGVMPEECNSIGQHINNTGLDIEFKFQSSGSSSGFFEEGHAFNISNGMKKLNIDDFEVDGLKTRSSCGNFPVNADNVFVFGSNPKNSGFIKENRPINMNKKTPNANHLSHDNSESNRSSSSCFSSVGIGIQQNGGFCETPSGNKDEKYSRRFTSKLAGLDSSDADYSTPNMKFTFSSNNLFAGMDNANTKLQGGKTLKKRNGKLRQGTVAQRLSSQNPVSKEGGSHQNHKSPGCGSPMDFSPYQDSKASNAPETDTSIGVKEESAASEKDTLKHSEKPHDEESNSNFSSSLLSQDGLSAVRRQYKKKYKLKVGSNNIVRGNQSDKENAKQEPIGAAAHEVCEHWRIRGNQAYHDGKLSKAEEFYSTGIDSVAHASTVGHSMEPLLLCYSNRAATRMSLGRMREAIEDCTKAAALDPNFLKVSLRAGNCYLVLGEVEGAIQCYSKCLSLRTDVCLDRRVTIEAADGLQKAKKVAEYMHLSAKLLQEGTDNAASNALEKIADALSISRYSERLLEMKGEALCIMRMYDEVIQLCEQTLDIARKNHDAVHLDDSKSSHMKLWRWHLQTKSHYHLGRLDLALELIEEQEKMPFSFKSGDLAQESSVALAATIRELLCLKKLGNEAFKSGRYTEAIENYTAAISKSSESRPFMAICFCNRAAAHQSVNQIIDAIADCSLAIALDENYQKAISRRATLYEMIRDYKQAVNDLQRLVVLLESQSQAKNQQYNSQNKSSRGSVRDLRRARRRLSLIEEKSKNEISLDLYLILGIKASVPESEIKKAYRKAALRHHPDKAGQVLVRSDLGDDGTLWKEVREKIHKDADRLFKMIGEAYAVLSDPSKRSQYDNEEELRNIYRDSSRNGNSSHPSTSYSSPYERGSWFGRQAGFGTSFERNNSRRHGYSHSRW